MKRWPIQFAIDMPLLWLGIVVSLALIFVADTITNFEIAFAVLYVAVILLSARSGRPRAILAVGVASGLLTILSYVLTRHGNPESGLMNGALSLLAIATTSYLAYKTETAEVAARETRADLARMARITSIGELATSIAHEVSQPLTAIVANANAAMRWLAATPPRQDEASRAIERVVTDAGRAGEVIGRVRQLVARVPPSKAQVDIIDVIEETLALTRGEMLRNAIVLRTDLADDFPVVMGDKVQLQQVILNFIVNAMEATQRSETKEILVSAAADGTKITVSVRDTGIGVPSDVADRVFEAFYTTKSTGIGMGLAISRSIIEAHGGAVYVAPNYPQGTVFGFTLPFKPRAEG
ncbi:MULTISPECIES: ATP-binding protein [unclassified Beijerinckia]|uniref:sensor histidine kinase n=1 Tax=unclassified Beijerinckia TaxID=2638183 RepID=UPI00089AE566|nr:MULTISPECIES: ATP-binding protein [unclassified Beijerinckia]MDH7796950.1 C4-dicarboxylate-specific signal transduction histidine kinase [Beijerinckia sp. GAS462]SEC66332.1 His Kinase A (phospho-acceptor) domain-containing protein [Beijerinckia sp. 28-YEA-48]